MLVENGLHDYFWFFWFFLSFLRLFCASGWNLVFSRIIFSFFGLFLVFSGIIFSFFSPAGLFLVFLDFF